MASYLLDNKFAPVTFQIGFVNGTASTFTTAYRHWMHLTLRRTRTAPISGSLDALLASCEPLDPEGRTALFCETRGDWVACFENASKQPEPVGIVSYLARATATRGIAFALTPNTLPHATQRGRGVWGALGFNLFGPGSSHPLGLLRSVMLTNDFDGWEFETCGEVLNFEHPERYRRRRKTERMDIDLLLEYARSLGIDLLAPAFYGPKATRIFADFPFREAPPGISYAAAQEQCGLV